MKAWIPRAFQTELPEEALGYLLGRGMLEPTIHRLGMSLWKTPAETAPDPSFNERYEGGKYLDGRLVCPALSPRGELLGFEARAWNGPKQITDYRLPEADWNPFFLGLTPDRMTNLWEGADIWIVEGLFDLAPMERVVPAGDVVLATVRAKVGEAHVRFIQRFLRKGHKVHMVYDNDETGHKQTFGWVDEKTGKRRWGALELFARVDVPADHVPYSGKDPGVIWDRGGEAALRAAFAHIL